jgi:hypothetical protein
LVWVRRWLTPSGHGSRPCHPPGRQGGVGGGGVDAISFKYRTSPLRRPRPTPKATSAGSSRWAPLSPALASTPPARQKQRRPRGPPRVHQRRVQLSRLLLKCMKCTNRARGTPPSPTSRTPT